MEQWPDVVISSEIKAQGEVAMIKEAQRQYHEKYLAEIEEAKTSGRPFRHIHNIGAGVSRIVYLTEEEIADAKIQYANWLLQEANKPLSLEDRITKLESLVEKSR